MFGKVGFENHRIRCVVGVFPKERESEQELQIDLKVTADFSLCHPMDDFAKAINYVDLANFCTKLAQKNQYRLLETFAVDLIEGLFQHYPIVEAWVKIKKPKAIATADFALVELSKRKDLP